LQMLQLPGRISNDAVVDVSKLGNFAVSQPGSGLGKVSELLIKMIKPIAQQFIPNAANYSVLHQLLEVVGEVGRRQIALAETFDNTVGNAVCGCASKNFSRYALSFLALVGNLGHFVLD